MSIKAVKMEAGVYRIGDYVTFREDCPSVGEWRDRWGNLVNDESFRSDVTWGVIDAATYDRREGDVGLPDCPVDFPTLRAATAWVQANAERDGEYQITPEDENLLADLGYGGVG